MAKKYTDGIVFASAFSPSGSQPLDNRTVVKSFSDLINENTFGDTKYDGMVVAVLDDQQTYMLIDSKNSLQASSWKKLGADESPIVKGDAENSAVFNGKVEYAGVSYENNAISQTSMALGGNNIAGLKGYYFTYIDFNTKQIWLHDKQITSKALDFVGGWKKNDTTDANKCKYSNGDSIVIIADDRYYGELVDGSYEDGTAIAPQYYDIKITYVDGNVITVDRLPFTEDDIPTGLLTINHYDKCSVFCPSKQDVGPIDFGGLTVAEGLNTKAMEGASHSEGYNTQAIGKYSHTEGRNNISYYIAHAEGDENLALGDYSHAEGRYNKSYAVGSHTEGRENAVYSNFGHAEGKLNVVAGWSSHAEGGDNVVYGSTSHVEGRYNQAIGESSHAEGSTTKALGDFSHSEGRDTVADGIESHAEGSATNAIGATSHAEGYKTYAYGENSHAEGERTITGDATDIYKGKNAHAEGYQSKAIGETSHAEGAKTIANGNASHAEGGGTIASGDVSHAEGDNTKAIGYSSHAEGYKSEATGMASHAEGGYYYDEDGKTIEVKGGSATGMASHAEGVKTIASGKHSHAEGSETQAIGNDSHAEGNKTEAHKYAHAEGYMTHATGDASHAEGSENTASGNASHAEGYKTNSTGIASHSEGLETLAQGEQSHAEGQFTKAIGNLSHAQNYYTEARGAESHAEGSRTKAYGATSHAEGYLTETRGENSHGEGEFTKTTNNNEHAQGQYNVSNSDKTIHSVGIGTSDTDRQNAHEITTDGKHYILGVGNYNGKTLAGATDVATVINNKADKKDVTTEINERINDIISGAPDTFDTLKEIADYIAEDKKGAVDMVSKISKVTSKVETLETDKADIDEVEKAKTVSEDIIIAGGPLADFALSVFPDGKIPSGTTFQDLFMTLLCQNIYPEVTTNTDEVKYKVEIPSFSISATGASNNATVEIGTSITFGSITANNVTVTKTNPQVSGFTHGYSDSLTGDIVNEDSITEEWTVNNISGGTFTLTASSSKFSGTLPTKAENAVYSSCKLSGCTLTVTEGENKYTVTESAPQQIGSHNGISSKFIVSNLGKRENDKKSDAIASETDVKQTPANKSASFTVNGVYPIYTNGVSASTVDSTAATMDGLIEPVEGDGTKLPLVKNGVKFAVSFASQTQAPYTLFVPQGMKITEAYAIDEFVNTYSVDCLNDFKLSNATTTRTVQNNTVTYSIYEWSGTNGANRVRFTVGK